MEELISNAKKSDTYDLGVKFLDLTQEKIGPVKSSSFLMSTGLTVDIISFELVRGMCWEEAKSLSSLHTGSDDGFYVSKTNVSLSKFCIYS